MVACPELSYFGHSAHWFRLTAKEGDIQVISDSGGWQTGRFALSIGGERRAMFAIVGNANQSHTYRSSNSISYRFKKALNSSWNDTRLWCSHWSRMYDRTSSTADWLTENAPYPPCQKKLANAGLRVRSQSLELFLICPTTLLNVSVRVIINNKCAWSGSVLISMGEQPSPLRIPPR